MKTTSPLVTIPMTEFRNHIGPIIRRVGKDGEHILIERGGLPVMVLVPVADYQNLINSHQAISHNSPSDNKR